MQTDVVADYEQLRTIQQAFYDEAEHIEQVLSTLNKQKEKLHGGEWRSNGASRFYDSMEDTTLPSMKRLHIALNNSGQLTGQIIIIFSEAEGLCVGDLDRKMVPIGVDPVDNWWVKLNGEELVNLLKELGGIKGIPSAVIDYVVGIMNGNQHDIDEFATQIISSVLQGVTAIGITAAIGIIAASAGIAIAKVTFGISVVVIGLNVVDLGALAIDQSLTHFAEAFGWNVEEASNWIDKAREFVSIDRRFDDMVRGWITQSTDSQSLYGFT